jgi:hypothetical protein
MKRIYQAATLQDAHIVSHLLADAHIPHHILNEHQQGGVGELPFTHAYPEIWLVNEGDERRALEIVAAFEMPANDNRPDTECPHCGERNPANFGLCWSCGRLMQQ